VNGTEKLAQTTAKAVATGAEKIAYKAITKTEDTLQYSDMFALCATDAFLFFILSKVSPRLGFVSHFAMVVALAMSLLSILPGLPELYSQCLRAYLATRTIAVAVGMLMAWLVFYPLLAVSNGLAGVMYNALHIGDYLFALLAVVSSCLIALLTYPFVRKSLAMSKELNSGNRYFFTSY
jgi:hypothetical protein